MIEKNGNSFALFLGCTIPLRFPFIESASRKVMKALGIQVQDLPFSCCPDPNGIQSANKDTWIALAAHNLCLAEEKELDILTICNGCYETLKVANYQLKNDQKLKQRVNSILKKVGKEFKGKINVTHIIPELYSHINQISELITNPLKDHQFAVHYGCHLLRPADILQTDDPENPVIIDKLVKILQGKSIEYSTKRLCCGAGLYGVNDKNSLTIVREKLSDINKQNAKAIIVTCPACFRQYEGGQPLIRRDFEETYGTNGKGIPVIYFTELLAYSLGLDMTEEFSQHHIKFQIS